MSSDRATLTYEGERERGVAGYTSIPAGHQEFPSLDGYRAIAALAVFVFHICSRLGLTQRPDDLSNLLARLGRYGVTVFFLLSGFLLFRRYSLRAFERRDPQPWGEFYANRALRIVPAYWLALAAGLMVVDHWVITRWQDYLILFGFAQIYFDGYHFRGNPVAWTLCIEVGFYLLLPAIAWVIRRLAGPSSGPTRIFQVSLAGLVILYLSAIVYRLVVLNAEDAVDYRLLWPFAYLDYFALGMLCGLLSAWSAGGRPLWKPVAFLGRYPGFSLVFAVQFYWLALQLNLPRSGAFPPNVQQGFWLPIFLTWSALFLLIPGFFGPRRQGGWRRLMQSRVLVFLGTISYGFYLWHILWLDWLQPSQLPFSWPSLAWLAIRVLVLTTVSSLISYRFVEQPLRRFKFSATEQSRGAVSRRAE